jgi:hypothetical protein
LCVANGNLLKVMSCGDPSLEHRSPLMNVTFPVLFAELGVSGARPKLNALKIACWYIWGRSCAYSPQQWPFLATYVLTRPGRQHPLNGDVVVQRQVELLEVVDALAPPRGLDRGEQQGDQDGNDGDDNPESVAACIEWLTSTK